MKGEENHQLRYEIEVKVRIVTTHSLPHGGRGPVKLDWSMAQRIRRELRLTISAY